MLNVLDRLPKRLWPEARRRLREVVWWAPTRAACEVRRDETALWLDDHGQDRAAETLYRDWDDFTTFYDFPAEHWLHLRTSNPISSRSSPASGCGRTSPSEHASGRTRSTSSSRSSSAWAVNWRSLNGGATVMTLVLAGERFVDGVLVKQPPREEERAA